LPYVTRLEKAGIPTVVIDFEDQSGEIRQTTLVEGIPNIRYVHARRDVPGPVTVDSFFEPMMDALTRPLSEKELESGKYEPPQSRVLFGGSLDEAETFYQQTKDIPYPVYAPISVYTDGFPIRVPTEERVQEMLTGTSRKPDELITYQSDRMVEWEFKRKGGVVKFRHSDWVATVEKVAINAVMAGCKPEHLPVILAMAESGCPTHGPGGWVCLSGPIVKEIKMNTGCGMLGPGSPVSAPIGRAYQLMAINLSGSITGVTRMEPLGYPFTNSGLCFAENADGLPPGWKGLNEEHGFKKDESIVLIGRGTGVMTGRFMPGGYRALQQSGHGALARRLGVKGIPGPHNWLEYLVPGLWAQREGAVTLLMLPEMAQHLYEYGFKSKDEVYEWLWKQSFIPLKEYRLRSNADFTTNGWLGIEKTSGKHWKELPDDYMVPAGGDDPSGFCIIIGGEGDERCYEFGGRDLNSVCNIDVWR